MTTQPAPDLWAAAYNAGYQACLDDVAARAAEVHLLTLPRRQQAILTAQQRIQARIAEMEKTVPTHNTTMGRHPLWRYRGGPVDYDTGMPANGFCTWLRRRQRTVAVDRKAAA